MPNLTIPIDGRRQYDFTTVAIANASMGRMPFDGVTEIFPGAGRYVVTGEWPTPKPTPTFSSSTAASTSAPAPKSSAAARAIWPNLP
jgi:hypothetical protein